MGPGPVLPKKHATFLNKNKAHNLHIVPPGGFIFATREPGQYMVPPGGYICGAPIKGSPGYPGCTGMPMGAIGAPMGMPICGIAPIGGMPIMGAGIMPAGA